MYEMAISQGTSICTWGLSFASFSFFFFLRHLFQEPFFAPKSKKKKQREKTSRFKKFRELNVT